MSFLYQVPKWPLLTAIFLSNSVYAGLSNRVVDLDGNIDNFSIVTDNPKLLDVLANDTGTPDSTTLLLSNTNSTEGGTLSIEAGKIRYAPPAGFSGTDSFTYQVTEQDWRNASALLAVGRAHESPAGSKPGTEPQEPIFDAIFPTGDWTLPLTPAITSYFGIVVKPVVDYLGCHSPELPSLTTELNWRLTKTTGDSQGYAASINNTNNTPDAPDSVTETDWGSSPQETRTLTYALSNISSTQFDTLKLGLFTQYTVNGAYHFWRSNDVNFSATLNTSSCTLSIVTVQVNLTVGTDSDNDGIIDDDDRDDDNDGVPDEQDGIDDDTDGDGIANKYDLDSDNDGITDLIEAGGVDQDGNGLVDSPIDNDGDGLHDAYLNIPLPLPDSDGDGIKNIKDLDSDNDGIPDITEAGGEDSNGDAVIDNFLDANANGLDDAHENGLSLPVGDVDADSKPNYIDRDSDGDNAKDLSEGGGDDSDANGIVDSLTDSDGDHIPDSADADQTGGSDSDGDGIDDSADIDQAGTADSDGDGINDESDPDRNNDGIADEYTTNTGGTPLPLPDSDSDGIPDYLDPAGSPNGPPSEDPTANTKVEAGLDGAGSFDLPLLIALFVIGMVSRRKPVIKKLNLKRVK